jgi:outer membrane receptor protein involved in Fe transport
MNPGEGPLPDERRTADPPLTRRTMPRTRAVVLALSLLVPCAVASAQNGTPPGAAGGPGRALLPQAPGEIVGSVLAAATGQPVASASVTVRIAGDSVLVAGALTRPDGTFRIEGLRPGRYAVRVRMLGYAPVVRDDIVVAAESPRVELGRIALEPVVAQLAGVQVDAEREATVLAPDRNSYAVKDMAAAAGGTAVDVLRNVPSVEVDGDNRVSLRGNQSVVVQINGRATPMRGEQLGNYLAQLPANLVSTVEVVANPSAKNDPEGMAGIINIVLKQETELGTSGGLMLGGGSTRQVNANGNLGHQSGPWTLFASYGFFRDRRTVDGWSTRALVDESGSLESSLAGIMYPLSHNATLNAEYKVNATHSIANNLVLNVRRFARDNGSFYRDLDDAGAVVGRTNQLTDQTDRGLNADYALTWRRTVHPQRNALVVEGRANHSRGDNDLLFTQQTPDDASDVDALERNATDDENTGLTAQLDWTRELRAGTKLETGYKGTFRTQRTDFLVLAGDAGGPMTPDAGRSNAFDFDEQVNAVYGVVSQQAGTVTLQAGLRAEMADTRFDLRTTDTRYDHDYRSLFPSGIVSWDVTPQRQLKASYSRRIQRPWPGQLNPFGFREDALTVFEGNPALRPEYTDSYELGLQQQLGVGSTLQLTPYVRRTTDAVRQYNFVDEDGVLHMRPRNAATVDQYGVDANLNFRAGPLSGFGGASAWRSEVDVGDLENARDVTSDGWSGRTNLTWKATPALDVSGFVMYRSSMRTEQGRFSSFTLTNVAIKQKLRGDKATATLRIMDPFGTMGWTMRTDDGRVLQLMDREFGARGAYLSFNWTFGQAPRMRPRPQEDQGAGGQPGMPGMP